MTMKKLAVLAAMAAFLGGCASPPMTFYSAGDDVPTATLSNEISGAYGRYEAITIGMSQGGRYVGTLFQIKQGKGNPPGTTKVPAGVALRIWYTEAASGDRSCSIDAEVTLEAGKSYALTGGFLYEKGPIPILTDTRKCQMAVVDQQTKTPVPMHRP